jgi:hypothetical protein
MDIMGDSLGTDASCKVTLLPGFRILEWAQRKELSRTHGTRRMSLFRKSGWKANNVLGGHSENADYQLLRVKSIG